MPEWVWVADCPYHTDFHADHYKKSIVMRKVKAHMHNMSCANIDCDDIRRVEAPNDLNYYPVREPKVIDE